MNRLIGLVATWIILASLSEVLLFGLVTRWTWQVEVCDGDMCVITDPVRFVPVAFVSAAVVTALVALGWWAVRRIRS